MVVTPISLRVSGSRRHRTSPVMLLSARVFAAVGYGRRGRERTFDLLLILRKTKLGEPVVHVVLVPV